MPDPTFLSDLDAYETGETDYAPSARSVGTDPVAYLSDEEA